MADLTKCQERSDTRERRTHNANMTAENSNSPVTLVTGAGRGIGRAVAVRLAREGHRLGLVARSAGELATTVELAGAAGADALAVAGDITDPAAVDRVCAAVERGLGPVEVLVNNAGYFGAVGTFLDSDPGQWWRVLETNLRGPALLDHRLLPGMLARGHGRVITVNSLAAVVDDPVTGSCGYAVSKAAVLRLDAALARELAGTGVRVFSISPGLVRTAMSKLRPDIDELPDEAFVPAALAADRIAALATGRYDALHGRFLHARDDFDALLESVAGQPKARTLTILPSGPADPVFPRQS